eukprot:12168-Rhodomonas_salina.1
MLLQAALEAPFCVSCDGTTYGEKVPVTALSYPILSYPILSYPVLFCPVMSCLVLSDPVAVTALSCPVSSYLILSICDGTTYGTKVP